MDTATVADKIQLGSKSQELKTCHRCGKSVKGGEFVLYKDSSGTESIFCLECEALIKQELKDKAKDIRLLKPFMYGLGATILASALWALFTIVSGWEIGYVGIGAAYLISRSILKASKQARSSKLQVLAVSMTILTVFFAHLVILFYFVLKQEGNESQLLTGLVGLVFTPSIWGTVLQALVQSQGPIGWLIIAITIYTAYNLTNPKVITAENVKTEKKVEHALVNEQATAEIKPQPVQDIKLDKKIARQISLYTLLYVFSALIGLIFIFVQTIPVGFRIATALALGALASFAVKRTTALKQQHPEQYVLTQKANNKLSFKRVILYSILGFFGLVIFIIVLGLILG
jgi:hypothetical protein